MRIAVTSTRPGDGKTGVAAAIARHFAYQGRPVTLARMAAEAGNAAADAAWFGSLFFVPGSPSQPLASAPADPTGEGIVVVECDLETAKSLDGARVVLVTRPGLKAPAGLATAATVLVGGQAPGTFGIALDNTLKGFSLSEARALTHADLLVPGDDLDPTCDNLVIAPISSDAGHTYFRRFAASAVVVRFDKTDMHLAAMAAEPKCLILTGGRRPSDYTIDAASARGVPVVLSRTDTENTVIALEPIFDRTRFHGERKLDRMAEMLSATGLFQALDG